MRHAAALGLFALAAADALPRAAPRAPRMRLLAPEAACLEQIRPAAAEDLPRVASLQLAAFAPQPPPPPLLPFLARLFTANQAQLRERMAQQLADEIEARVARGADLIVAAAGRQTIARLAADGTYGEEDAPRLLGAVEVSAWELELPTHALCGGMYLSHLVVDAPSRRQGIGQRLLRAAEERAAARGFDGMYLHVERVNSGAIALYEACGYKSKPDVPPYRSFTQALNLQHRDPVLMYRSLS
ncbi:hypothetical protein AB1Y20_016465 [Prymnesium parvum]|uniref:N-acetyltransferase domain-containing protein n=1 Tax=Prymnesium parvum TaxID=97485 RepID=A0AB34ID20_PRYPA